MHQPHSGGNTAGKEMMATHALPKQVIESEIKMEEEISAGSEIGEDMQGAALPAMGRFKEFQSSEISQRVKQEPDEGPSRNWDILFQEFLKTLQVPLSREENPQFPELRQWSNPISSPVSEGPSHASKWPRGLWVFPPQPHIMEQLRQEQNSHLDATQSGKGSSGVLPGDAIRTEVQRLQFRLFCYRESEGPRKTYLQLQELCCQWLKPERHTKEQILDQLILEQFLVILPSEMQHWVLQQDPETCTEAVMLAENFLVRQQEDNEWDQQGEMSLEKQPLLEPSTSSAERLRLLRASETPEQRELRLTQQRLRQARLRAAETPEQRELRLTQQRIRQARRRAAETTEQTEERIRRIRVLQAERISSETPDQTAERLQRQRVRKAELRAAETLEQREKRQEVDRVRHSQMKEMQLKRKKISNEEENSINGKQHSKDEEWNILATSSEMAEERMISEVSEEEFVNPPKAGETLPSAVNTQRFAEIKQEDSGGTILLGNRWLNKNKEQKPELESPEEKEPPRTPLETAEENSVLCGGEADENQEMVESQNENISEEIYQFVLSQMTHKEDDTSIHQGENRKKYEKCGESFGLLNSDDIHTEKLYKCWHCGKSFCSSSDLMTHERTHVGEKLYICSLCGESERTHANQKPHKCSHCGSTFY